MVNSKDSEKDSKHENKSCTDGISHFTAGLINGISRAWSSTSRSSEQKPDDEISESEKLELKIKARAEKRRLERETEEKEEMRRRQDHEQQMIEADSRKEEERRDYDSTFANSKRETEDQRSRLEEENDKSLEQHKRLWKSKNDEEFETMEARREEKNLEMSRNLITVVEDRKRVFELQTLEIENYREETQEKVDSFEREQEETKARWAREDAEFEEELTRMDAENREARERQKRIWEDRLKTMKEQYDMMMKEMAQNRWTITMERNFDARLNFYRAAGKNIRRKFEQLTELLVTYKEYLRRLERPDETRLRPVTMQAEELRNAVQKQTEVLVAEISNLENMHKEAGWPFLNDIRDSLQEVLQGCNIFLEEINENYLVQLNLEHIKTGEALRQMNSLYENVSKSYSQIPTMDFLSIKHGRIEEEGSSSSNKEEHQTDDGHVFYIEEPED